MYQPRPPRKPTVPVWDIQVVLTALKQAPFEPPESVPLDVWTRKMAFLVAITSGARVSELTALDSSRDMLILREGSATLIPNRAFLPKVPTVQNVNRRIELDAFPPGPETHGQRHLKASVLSGRYVSI